MEQRDYLLRQLQMMTQAIVALIRRITGLKDQGTEEEIKQATDVMLKEYFDTSLTEIMQVPTEKCVEFLIRDKKLHPSNADMFAQVLMINADKSEKQQDKEKLLHQAMILLEWIDETGGVYSAERHQKIKDIRSMLEKL